ncbi:MAG: pilus assembly protein TadE [Firmicutes bacterium HGW-Firmicutes-12]|nr:MAG: pilus assembly protein TadE [Firmicutes bacterium HGW-Firmicutes-12]
MKKVIREKKGQALIEFAFVIPILLLLLFGIVEFSRIFGAELVVTYSAREGARTGAVGGTDEVIRSQVQNAAVNLDPAGLVIVINPIETERTRGQQLSVEVSYPVTIVVPLISIITGDTVMVGSTCVMRIE